jgi:hypothetical protein
MMATATGTEEFERRVGKNEALFREVNERVNEINQAHEIPAVLMDWMCECADEACTDRLTMTAEEYERLRQDPTHFAVLGSQEHFVVDVERVVERHARYWIVEKVGAAADVAEDLDPRFGEGS